MSDASAAGGERPAGGGLFGGFGNMGGGARGGRSSFGDVRGKFRVDASGVDKLRESFRNLNRELRETERLMRNVNGGGAPGGGGRGGGAYFPTANPMGMGGFGGSGGGIPGSGKALAGVAAFNLAQAGIGAMSNRMAQVAAVGVEGSQNNWMYQQSTGMSSSQMMAQRLRAAQQTGSGGSYGVNTVAAFQSRTGLLAGGTLEGQTQNMANMRAMSGYTLSPDQVMQSANTLGQAGVVNRMQQRFGTALVGVGGQINSPQQVFATIIQKLNWSKERWEVAKLPGSRARAFLRDAGIPDDQIDILIMQAINTARYSDELENLRQGNNKYNLSQSEIAGLGKTFTGTQAQIKALGGERELSNKYEKTISAQGARDERMVADQAEALRSMFDNTTHVTNALSDMESALKDVIDPLIRMAPYLSALGNVLGSLTGGGGGFLVGSLLRGGLGRGLGGLGRGIGGLLGRGGGAVTAASRTAASGLGKLPKIAGWALAGAQFAGAAGARRAEKSYEDDPRYIKDEEGNWVEWEPDVKAAGIGGGFSLRGAARGAARAFGINIGDPMPGDTGGAPNGSSAVAGAGLAGVHPTLAGRVQAMQKENPRVKVSSGYRSPAKQRQLFLSRYTQVPNKTANSVYWEGKHWVRTSGDGPTAPPGQSMHELGLAVDLGGDASQYDWIVANSARFKLRNFKNLNGEPWHVQPIELPQTRYEYEKMGSPWGSGSGGTDAAATAMGGGASAGASAGAASGSDSAGPRPSLGGLSMGLMSIGGAGIGEGVLGGLTALSVNLGSSVGLSGGAGVAAGAAAGASSGTSTTVGGASVGGLTGQQLSAAQVAQIAHAAGFRGEALARMVAIAQLESNFNTGAYNGNNLDRSYGLWQINMYGNMGPARAARYGLKSYDELFNPQTNAKAAWDISGGGKNFNPWTTNAKVTEQMMDNARQAMRSAGVGDGTFVSQAAPSGGGGTSVVVTNHNTFSVQVMKASDAEAERFARMAAGRLEEQTLEASMRRG